MRLLISKKDKTKYYRHLRYRIYLVVFLAIILTGGVFYGILNLSFFKIKKIETAGAVSADQLSAEVLKNSWVRFLSYKHFWAWPAELAGVRIEKDYANGILRLVAPNTEKFAIWCSQGSSSTSSETTNLLVPEHGRGATLCYWIDRRGIAGEPAPITEGSSIAVIRNQDGGNLVTGAPVIQERFIKLVVGIIDGIANLPIRVKEYSFNARLQELTAIGVGEDKFVFSVRFEPTEKLFASLAEVIAKNNLKNFEYIDLTVENRIYLKQR